MILNEVWNTYIFQILDTSTTAAPKVTTTTTLPTSGGKNQWKENFLSSTFLINLGIYEKGK